MTPAPKPEPRDEDRPCDDCGFIGTRLVVRNGRAAFLCPLCIEEEDDA